MMPLIEKRLQLLNYEEGMARRLAGQVMDKPKPPIWMIFIPVFFVFFAMKLSDYKKGLADFVKNYLIARERALDLACESIEEEKEAAIDRLMENASTLPKKAQPLYRDWITLQTEHYRNLLLAPGESMAEMVRNHYRNKAAFLVVNNRLTTAENTFNSALLPDIEGDGEDISYIGARIERFSTEMRRQEVDELFSLG